MGSYWSAIEATGICFAGLPCRCEGWGEGISTHTCEQLSQQPIHIPSSSLLPTLEAFSRPLAKPTVLDPSPRAGRQRSAYGTLQKSFFLPMKTPAKNKKGSSTRKRKKEKKKQNKKLYIWGMVLMGTWPGSARLQDLRLLSPRTAAASSLLAACTLCS